VRSGDRLTPFIGRRAVTLRRGGYGTRSPDLVRQPSPVGDCGAVSAYILEIKAVVLRGEGPVGYGVDDLGREFEVALDPSLAADIATALDDGRRPIVAVERGRSIPPATQERAVVGQVMARRNARTAANPPSLA
jgi:hypothetical protein